MSIFKNKNIIEIGKTVYFKDIKDNQISGRIKEVLDDNNFLIRDVYGGLYNRNISDIHLNGKIK